MSTHQPVDPATNASLFILQDDIHEPMHDRFLWTARRHRDQQAEAIPEGVNCVSLAQKLRSIRSHTSTVIWRNSNATRSSAVPTFTGRAMPPNTMKSSSRSCKLTMLKS